MKTKLNIFTFLIILLLTSCDNNPELVNDVFFNTELGKLNTDSVRDFDGNVYHTVTIGNQVWMTENLKVTHYADGTPIAESFAPNGDNNNIKKYGRLYSFDVAMRGDSIKGSQGICPAGWHLPTREEWEKLIETVQQRKSEVYFAEKLCSTTDWTGGKNGTNFTLFNAYPTGINKDNASNTFGSRALYWVGELNTLGFALMYQLCPDSTVYKSQFYQWDDLHKYNDLSNIRLSVRCIKNTDNLKLPTVVIDSVSLITPKPTVYGRVTDTNNGTIIKAGICYSQTVNVNLKDSVITAIVNSSGKFSCVLNVNAPNSTYYLRAFAANKLGSGFSKEVTCKTTAFLPQLSEVTLTKIGATTATLTASVTDDGGNAITAKGVCWSILVNPTTISSKTSDGSGSGTFESNITGLTANTSYYVRAYAINGKGTGYNEQVLFITLPTVNVGTTSNLTYKSTSMSGTIPTQGTNTIIEYGHCWSTSSSPTLADNKATSINLIGGNFTTALTGLAANTKYYVRAFIKNSSGTNYSSETSFTTPTVVLPTVTVGTVSSITYKSATVGGVISAQGELPIVEYGHCWSTTTNPTISNNKLASTNLNLGSFSTALTGLTQSTKYYVRAYTTTSSGTNYSNETTFTTSAIILPTVTIGNISNLTFKSAIVSGGISVQGDLPITEYGHCWSKSTLPTISNNKLASTNLNSGSFSTVLTGLIPSTKYYVRSYTTTSSGTNYSSETTFTTPADPYTVSDGLLAFYNFNGQNANDDLGTYNGVSLGGITYSTSSPSSSGYAAQFDGTSGYINIQNQILPSSGSWTYSSWVKTNGTYFGLIYSGNIMNSRIYSSKLTISASWSYNYNFTNDLSTSLLDNNWHQLTISYNGSALKYYIDGLLIESLSVPFEWGTLDYTKIGVYYSSTDRYFSGLMDNIRFYNRALSTTEITTLYNAKQ